MMMPASTVARACVVVPVIASLLAGLNPAYAMPEKEGRVEISLDRTTVTLISDAVWGPGYDVRRTDGSCESFPNNMQGGLCYRFCGGSISSPPAAVTFQWRIAHRGHAAPFVDCKGDCRAFNVEWYSDVKRMCATFLLSGDGHGRQHDLRMDVKLSSPVPQPQPQLPRPWSHRHF